MRSSLDVSEEEDSMNIRTSIFMYSFARWE